MDDYHAFTSTTGNDKDGNSCSGCSFGCLPGIIAALTILCLIGKVFV